MSGCESAVPIAIASFVTGLASGLFLEVIVSLLMRALDRLAWLLSGSLKMVGLGLLSILAMWGAIDLIMRLFAG